MYQVLDFVTVNYHFRQNYNEFGIVRSRDIDGDHNDLFGLYSCDDEAKYGSCCMGTPDGVWRYHNCGARGGWFVPPRSMIHSVAIIKRPVR